jgi:hypothetical protein
VIGIVTFGFGLVVIWPISMVWAAISASAKSVSHVVSFRSFL